MNGLLTLAESPVSHVINHKFLDVNGWWVWTSAQGNLLLTAIIMLALGPYVANKIATGPESEGHDRFVTRNPLAHLVEVISLYLREKVIEPLLHERTDKFLPFLLILFFFILINNVLGLIPILDVIHLFFPGLKAEHRAPFGGTATQSIYVTGALAIVAAIVINGAGIRELGLWGYIKHLTAGAPFFVWPIIIPIELAGILIKPIALAIRLFANMTAGHILLATLLGFIKAGFSINFGAGLGIGAVSLLGAIAIMFLELFVAFLQAFVFMFLTALFISLLSHHGEHDEHHAHDDAHEEESPTPAMA
ncbi:MAG: F0F1 ATP synthase subunit A [Phycisphaerales bacterium JB059]